uniref:Uncharacterized protein n=1 Tax=Plectus sambesii TaxID=2011161 RepID=A0A914WQP6_9BILA
MNNSFLPNGMEPHLVVYHQPQFAINRYKIAVIGAPKVGKSSIARRLCYNRFDQDVPNTPSKQAFQLKLPDHVVAKIEVVDVASNKLAAGNEEKKPPRASDFVDVCGVLVVYDVTDRATFDGIADLLRGLKTLIAPDCEVMLVGNKSDAIPTVGRAVTFTDADKYAQKSGMSLFEMSAKSGEHCKEAVVELVQKVREKWQLRPFSSPLSSSTDDSCDENIFPKQSIYEDCVEKTSPPPNRIWCSLWRCA